MVGGRSEENGTYSDPYNAPNPVSSPSHHASQPTSPTPAQMSQGLGR